MLRFTVAHTYMHAYSFPSFLPSFLASFLPFILSFTNVKNNSITPFDDIIVCGQKSGSGEPTAVTLCVAEGNAGDGDGFRGFLSFNHR